MQSRRSFLRQSAAVTAGFTGLHHLLAGPSLPGSPSPLVPDPLGILDLPPGFHYRILSSFGDPMADGYTVPGLPDGMGAFASPDGRKTILICNHEIGLSRGHLGPFPPGAPLPPGLVYDPGDGKSEPPLQGGTTTLVYDHLTGTVDRQFLSLIGTDRNCAGGITPWGTWISCEEPADLTSPRGRLHGYCFEVVPSLLPTLSPPLPLPALGRFRHEAIAVHPSSGAVYLTEDCSDGLLYRFLPTSPGNLAAGGRLQALHLLDHPSIDTRNWPDSPSPFPTGKKFPVAWRDLTGVDSPQDDLRLRGFDSGAALFSRGEGIWYAAPLKSAPREAVYWCCTDGGNLRLGQVFRYLPSPREGHPDESTQPATLELFLEPNNAGLLRNGDNLTIAPWGDVIIAEDGSPINCLRGVTPEGKLYTLARNALNSSEFAGCCFGPDEKTLFVNIMSPGLTFAISGPWLQSRPA